MTFVLFGLLSSGRFLRKKDPTRNVNIALQALRSLLSRPPPRGNFFGSFAPWDFFLFLSRPLGGQERGEGSQGAPGVVSGVVPSPPASASVQREGWECL